MRSLYSSGLLVFTLSKAIAFQPILMTPVDVKLDLLTLKFIRQLNDDELTFTKTGYDKLAPFLRNQIYLLNPVTGKGANSEDDPPPHQSDGISLKQLVADGLLYIEEEPLMSLNSSLFSSMHTTLTSDIATHSSVSTATASLTSTSELNKSDIERDYPNLAWAFSKFILSCTGGAYKNHVLSLSPALLNTLERLFTRARENDQEGMVSSFFRYIMMSQHFDLFWRIKNELLLYRLLFVYFHYPEQVHAMIENLQQLHLTLAQLYQTNVQDSLFNLLVIFANQLDRPWAQALRNRVPGHLPLFMALLADGMTPRILNFSAPGVRRSAFRAQDTRYPTLFSLYKKELVSLGRTEDQAHSILNLLLNLLLNNTSLYYSHSIPHGIQDIECLERFLFTLELLLRTHPELQHQSMLVLSQPAALHIMATLLNFFSQHPDGIDPSQNTRIPLMEHALKSFPSLTDISSEKLQLWGIASLASAVQIEIHNPDKDIMTAITDLVFQGQYQDPSLITRMVNIIYWLIERNDWVKILRISKRNTGQENVQQIKDFLQNWFFGSFAKQPASVKKL